MFPSRPLVEALCSDACAGRAAGTEGGELARRFIVDGFSAVGCSPVVMPAPGCGGANVVVTLPGAVDRWVLVGAHYDHLGSDAAGRIYRGANDNAAAVGVLVELGRRLAANPPTGRGVLLVAFDGEEPPFFSSGKMGSQDFVRAPPVPLDQLDLMLALELVGAPLGGPGLPAALRDSLFVLGAERSEGTPAEVDRLASAVEDLHVRRADAEIIPPLSDHLAFWEAGVPFLLVTGLRSATYHSPEDTVDTLRWDRVTRVTDWLDRFVRAQCNRPEERIVSLATRRDDRSTLDTARTLLEELRGLSPLAAEGLKVVDFLWEQLDASGALPLASRQHLERLVGLIESGLAG